MKATKVIATILLLGVFIWSLFSAVQAQEILKGKIPFATATCPVDKHYVMGKGKPLERPCILFIDPTTEDMVGYALILDKQNKPQAVIETDFTDAKNPKQRVVWRKGQRSM